MEEIRFVTNQREKIPGSFKKYAVVFYSIYARSHFHQDARLITGAGANFEHFVAWSYFQLLGLKGYRKRLRNGLAFADGKSLVLVGMFKQCVLKKKHVLEPARLPLKHAHL